MTETKIARYGNSLTVRLPAALARDLDLREGDVVTLRRIEGGLAIERRPGARLAAMLATVTGPPEGEWDTGPAVGREVWD
ncbi:MAG TPA: AbrB/MazE/SpoVT family DNA-binding domain-containing protein [Candidatus Elarobacter sp.]|jgi:antitoxin component of MazEF toxin-antitoxin module|nr:AbrB/MazE/SpoVT family DNA-binding domain-containing protein [Candidatus Elarobacter sp.]